MLMKQKEGTLAERITLLQDLNRPLEEHWSVKSKFGLDAKASDYIYKHHVSRLEHIYNHRRFDIHETPKMFNMSPLAQLYGIHGLQSTSDTQIIREKKKEGKWIGNFQKYHAIADSAVPSNALYEAHLAAQQREDQQAGGTMTPTSRSSLSRSKQQRSRPWSASSGAAAAAVQPSSSSNNHGNQQGPTDSHPNPIDHDHHHHHGYHSQGHGGHSPHHHQQPPPRFAHYEPALRRYDNPGNNQTELSLYGLYQLDPDQLATFTSFVQLLQSFEAFDRRHLVEDTLQAAYDDYLLEDYDGVDFFLQAAHPGHSNNNAAHHESSAAWHHHHQATTATAAASATDL